MKPWLTLRLDSSIDLHMHTTYSDGQWPAERLIGYLADEGFDLVAVTDHDRVDKVTSIQDLGAQRQLAVLAGVEMSTQWHGQMGDVLCYGFDPAHPALRTIAEQLARLQYENTLATYDTLLSQGFAFPRKDEVLAERNGEVRIGGDLVNLLRAHNYVVDWHAGVKLLKGAGYESVRVDMAETVEAVHSGGGVCLMAHPGRREPGFTFYTPELLDQVRAEVPLDGIEVMHPTHTPELTETYLTYAREHKLLQSTGSDSHGNPKRLPIKYRAEISRDLLERIGIQFE